MDVNAIETLSELLARPEGRWSLAEGAVAVARLRDPGLSFEAIAASMDELGAEAREEIAGARHPRFVAAGIARALFERRGFTAVPQGDEQPEALFIDLALATRRALPSLLVLLFIETARRAGFRFSAIALPGMTLLRHDAGDRPFLFDPVRAARPVTVDEVRGMVSSALAGKASKPEFREGWLRPLTQEQLLARMLTNLKALHWRAGHYDAALGAIRLLLAIRPDDPREIRDSGRLLFLLTRYHDAIGAFETYLSHNPHGEDADAVRMLLLEARAGLTP